MDTEGSSTRLIWLSLKLRFLISNYEIVRERSCAVVENLKIVIFFFVAGNFRPERVEAIAERYGLGTITFPSVFINLLKWTIPPLLAPLHASAASLTYLKVPLYRSYCCPYAKYRCRANLGQYRHLSSLLARGTNGCEE